MGAAELGDTFACFGSSCTVLLSGESPRASAAAALADARRSLLGWHERFSRFLPSSELSALNADPHEEVAVSALMARLAQATAMAGALTQGLVDATLLAQIERAGYREDLREPVPLSRALALAPPRAPAHPAGRPGWSKLRIDIERRTIRRPPGVLLDSGGLAKGLLADVLGERLADHDSFAVNCAGDLLIGGSARSRREIHVESPFDGSILHSFKRTHTAVATSGIGRRSWLDADGRPAHHLLDPASGRPAFTGIVQVTALAPSALLAEIYAKAALLSGPSAAPRWLPHGGVIVLDDASHHVIEPAPTVSVQTLATYAPRQPAALSSAGGCSARANMPSPNATAIAPATSAAAIQNAR